jgi:uncharacterized protein (DUF2236 family)
MNHSRYEKEPLGRLAGTIRWLTVTTFACNDAVQTEANRVNRMHTRVVGNEPVSYRAADPHLLLWVHIAFMDSFLAAHQRYCVAPIPGGADAYIEQWGRSVAPLGLTDVPASSVQLDQLMQRFQSELVYDQNTEQVVRFIKNPPLPKLVKPVYKILFHAAVISLRPEHRELLGLSCRWPKLTTVTTRFALKAIRVLIGPESPIEDGALRRLQNLKLI